MQYTFFLFFNLYSVSFPEIMELHYDIMYDFIKKQYDLWEQFDTIPKYREMGAYESMEAYISKIKG